MSGMSKSGCKRCAAPVPDRPVDALLLGFCTGCLTEIVERLGRCTACGDSVHTHGGWTHEFTMDPAAPVVRKRPELAPPDPGMRLDPSTIAAASESVAVSMDTLRDVYRIVFPDGFPE